MKEWNQEQQRTRQNQNNAQAKQKQKYLVKYRFNDQNICRKHLHNYRPILNVICNELVHDESEREKERKSLC